jgi:hypothetical protein
MLFPLPSRAAQPSLTKAHNSGASAGENALFCKKMFPCSLKDLAAEARYHWVCGVSGIYLLSITAFIESKVWTRGMPPGTHRPQEEEGMCYRLLPVPVYGRSWRTGQSGASGRVPRGCAVGRAPSSTNRGAEGVGLLSGAGLAHEGSAKCGRIPKYVSD